MKKLITDLTPEQQDQFDVYRDKWIKIGHSTAPCDRALAESLVESVYTSCKDKLAPPKQIVWADSPIQAIDIVEQEFNKRGEECNRMDIFHSFCYGQHDTSWLAFYDYCYEVLELYEEVGPLIPFMNFSKEVHWFLPYDEMIVICDRPEFLSLKDPDTETVYQLENEQPTQAILNCVMHCDGGASVRYRDGFELYRLNGVDVPEYLAKESARELDTKLLTTITNAEVRREFVRKVGMERILEELGGRTIDTQLDEFSGENYELILFEVGDLGERPFLKMTNPSIGGYHVEGVPPHVVTVAQALEARNQTKVKPDIVT